MVVFGPYYWKHKIYTLDKFRPGDSKETCIMRITLTSYVDCFYVLFHFKDGGDYSRRRFRFRFWLGHITD